MQNCFVTLCVDREVAFQRALYLLYYTAAPILSMLQDRDRTFGAPTLPLYYQIVFSRQDRGLDLGVKTDVITSKSIHLPYLAIYLVGLGLLNL